MNDSEKILLVVLAVIVAGGIFWGVQTAIKKSFVPVDDQSQDTSSLLTDQRRRAQEIRNQQKRLLESQKQRARDFRR